MRRNVYSAAYICDIQSDVATIAVVPDSLRTSQNSKQASNISKCSLLLLVEKGHKYQMTVCYFTKVLFVFFLKI